MHTFNPLGILSLIHEPDVTEIAINEPNIIFYEKNSQWQHKIVENNQSNQLIEGLGKLLVNSSGQNQHFDQNHPMLSLTMPGGERAQLIRKPAAEECSLTVRIPSKVRFSMDQYGKGSYGHLWCMGNWGRWRILLIDFVQDFNNREMIRHDQVYPTGVA